MLKVLLNNLTYDEYLKIKALVAWKARGIELDKEHVTQHYDYDYACQMYDKDIAEYKALLRKLENDYYTVGVKK